MIFACRCGYEAILPKSSKSKCKPTITCFKMMNSMCIHTDGAVLLAIKYGIVTCMSSSNTVEYVDQIQPDCTVQ